jgi:hypothetical protein
MVVAATLVSTGCGMHSQSGGTSNSLNLSGTFPPAVAGTTYNAVLSVSGGSAPYHFALQSGSLAEGLTLNSATGSISGIPASEGSYSFEIVVTDAQLRDEGVQKFAIIVGRRDSVQLSVSPTSLALLAGQTQQFTATVSGTKNTSVTWSASEGSIDASGLYSAPTVTAPTNVTVTAIAVADPEQKASASVTVDKVQSLTITNGALLQGHVGVSYSEIFTATGGAPPYSWSISAGTPPAGVTLASDGTLAGLPSSAGIPSFTVSVKDSNSLSAQHNFSLEIVSGGNFDGPAELPRLTVASSMADTPAPGTIITVNAGADLQAALNSAHCGDTVALQAGATFDRAVTLPAKPCDDQHWIILRTNAPDSALPPEGQRLTPCYAGLASLPNRPAYNCPKAQTVLAKISRSVIGDGPVIFASGANHYRLLGLEITRPADKVAVVALVSAAQNEPADHIIIDRSWIHGTAQDETRRGVALKGTTYVAIVDSYLNDFHCAAVSGTCTDSQATGGGTGNLASGPWKIENNFLEAAGENILFGGAPSTIVASDITIRRNHFYKVPQWQKGSPGFVGGYSGDPFVVKNHFEIKNASHVLLEANLFEYSWGGFSQFGHSIVITPRNQYNQITKQGNLCSICQATDVTIRYNKISHVGAGVNLSNNLTDNYVAEAGERYSIHDLIIEDIDHLRYVGGGGLVLMMNWWPTKTLNNVSIRHVTGFPDRAEHMLSITNDLSYPQMYGFTFQDNMVVVPKYPVWSAGGPNSCAASDVPITVLATCFKTYTFTNNVLSAVSSVYPPEKWPSENFFPATVSDVGFVNYNNGNGGDYHLLPNSQYKGKASDGRDPGADIDAVNAALEGVE